MGFYGVQSAVVELNTKEALAITDKEGSFEYQITNIEFVAFNDQTLSFNELMEPFSQNTPAIDLITANQSANENITSSFAENKLTGLSIDTGGHQNIVKIELEIYFSDLSSSNVLPFECKFSNAAPEGMSLTKIGAGKYKALINLGDREPESVMTEFLISSHTRLRKIWLVTLKFI